MSRIAQGGYVMKPIRTLSLAAATLAIFAASTAEAQRARASQAGMGQARQTHQVRSQAHTNVNRDLDRNANRNVNRNSNRNVNRNVNRDLNVDVDVHHDYGYGYGWDDHYHPVATAAVVTAAAVTTAAIIGSMVRTLPPSCVTVIRVGISYYQCGSVWYQPTYVGSNVQYVVVEAP
jgi:hypothetical protein